MKAAARGVDDISFGQSNSNIIIDTITAIMNKTSDTSRIIVKSKYVNNKVETRRLEPRGARWIDDALVVEVRPKIHHC